MSGRCSWWEEEGENSPANFTTINLTKPTQEESKEQVLLKLDQKVLMDNIAVDNHFLHILSSWSFPEYLGDYYLC